MYYVYVLISDDGCHYTGKTSDMQRRLQDHNAGHNESTRGKKWHLVYYEAYTSKEDAHRREMRLKDGRAKKELFKRIDKSLQIFMV